MRGREDQPAVHLVFANEVRRGRGRTNPTLPHNAFRSAISGGHAEDDLDRAVIEIATVPTSEQGFPRNAADPIKNRLHVVFKKMRLHKGARFLAKPARPRFLALNWLGRDGDLGHYNSVLWKQMWPPRRGATMGHRIFCW